MKRSTGHDGRVDYDGIGHDEVDGQAVEPIAHHGPSPDDHDPYAGGVDPSGGLYERRMAETAEVLGWTVAVLVVVFLVARIVFERER